jgi:hypothetical protein
MGCEVYANGDEIACKAGDGKVNASAPDVCMSPPSPPAGPIPVPYMDSSFSKDMKNGSKTVKIKGKEVMLKDKSFYKTSPLGNEAATRSFGANVISHVITGKTYFIMWSMDVKFEGLNVDRHDDMTTSNHASPTAGVPLPNKNRAAEAEKSNAFTTTKVPLCAPDAHKWDCTGGPRCADCWRPPCPDNAKKENDAYNAEQAKPKDERIENQIAKLEAELQHDLDFVKRHEEMMASRRALIGSGKATAITLPMARAGIREHRQTIRTHEGAAYGKQAEIDAIKKHAADITHVGYKTHCTICHTEQEVDIVTKDFVGEVKHIADDHDWEQMARINSIREQCFPNKDTAAIKKDTAAMVPAHEVPAMQDKVDKWKTTKNSPGAQAVAGKIKVMDP